MGQNKNQFVSAALLHFAATSAEINQKILELGHTQIACDSMHSAIEFTKKPTSVYVPSQWDTIIAMARRRNPYRVIQMKFYDFTDMKDLTKQTNDNIKVDISGKAVNWKKLKWIQYRKDKPESLFIKQCTRGDKNAVQVEENPKPVSLKRNYDGKLPISKAKHQNLLALCKSGIIPAEFPSNYKSLKTDASLRDRLPVPDVKDDDCLQ